MAKAAKPTRHPTVFETVKSNGFTWIKTSKDQWVTDQIPDGEAATPRIKELDAKTFSVYRDGKYLGSEKSFALATARAKANKRSATNLAPPPPVKVAKGVAVDPAKAPKRAALAGVAPNGRVSPPDVPTSGIIRVKAGAAVPKKPGTAAYGRWTVLWEHDGKQIAAYEKGGGNMTTLQNAMAKNYVTIEE